MPQTTEQIAADLKWASDQFGSDRFSKAYPEYRDYYDGIQDLSFASLKFERAFGNMFEEFAYNRCGSVVDAIADRIRLLGMNVTNEKGDPDESNQETLAKIWRVNQMDRKQGEAWTEGLKMGDAYAIVWPESIEENGVTEVLPRIYINSAGSTVIRYDSDTKKKLVAIKAWKTADNKWRINFYYPDATWKYVTPDKKDDFPKDLAQLVLFTPDPLLIEQGVEFAEPNPVPNPYNEIPVFHLANNSKEGDFGRSELANIIPLQDALNKACMDMMVAMEYGAYPQRYAIGLALGMPDPATGRPKQPFKEGPGEIWTGPTGASFGNFDAADLQQFLDVQTQLDQKISNVSRIPAHWLTMGTGEFPSGEALKTAEAPFTAKIEDRHTDFGQWAIDVFTFCLKTMSITGVLVKPNWKTAELRSELDMYTIAETQKRLGFSDEYIFEKLGLTPDQIAEIQQQKQDALMEQQKLISNGIGAEVPSGGGNRPPETGSGNKLTPFRGKTGTTDA